MKILAAMKINNSLLLIVLFISTIHLFAQLEESVAFSSTKVSPGYLGKKSFVGYDLGIASSYFTLASFLDQNKDSRFVPIHNVFFEQVVSKKSALGVVVSVSHNYGGELSGNYNPIDLLNYSNHHPEYEGLVNRGELPNSRESVMYMFDMDQATTSGYGLGIYFRRYFTESYAPIGWFYEFQLAFWNHTTTGVNISINSPPFNSNEPRIVMPLTPFENTKTTTSFVAGLGFSWGITDRLLFSISSHYNYNAILNYVKFGNYDLVGGESNFPSPPENGNYQENMDIITSTRTYYFNLVQAKFSLRYAL